MGQTASVRQGLNGADKTSRSSRAGRCRSRRICEISSSPVVQGIAFVRVGLPRWQFRTVK